MNSPIYALRAFQLRRKLSKKARNRLIEYEESDQFLLYKVMEAGPKAFTFLNTILELSFDNKTFVNPDKESETEPDKILETGIDKAKFLYKAFVEYEIPPKFMNIILNEKISITLSESIVERINTRNEEDMKKLLKEVGKKKKENEIKVPHEVEIARSIKDFPSPDGIKDTTKKVKEDPDRYFGAYNDIIAKREKAGSNV